MSSSSPGAAARRRLALLSVSDKTGLEALGRGLVSAGYTLVSTGGTASALETAGLPVVKVGELTGHPEIMGGRVKTLHPKVHGGILGLRDVHAAEAEAHGIAWIDVVVVNLYPFEATVSVPGVTVADAVEQIDIGGPTMVRAAAKNHRDVTVVTSPADYPRVLSALSAGGEVPLALRQELAVRAFQHTALYDSLIAGWLGAQVAPQVAMQEGAIPLRRAAALRYGENPHQEAVFFASPGEGGRSLGRAVQLQGKQLSFNNLADLDGTLRAVFELDAPGCVIVKHMNPCGAATHTGGLAAAFGLALSADPVSAYGGIVAFNRPLAAEDVRAIRRSRVFFEVLAAPGFSDEARSLLASRENLRVMELPADWGASRPAGMDARRVQGGWLLQSWDVEAPMGWTVASKRAPTEAEAEALQFAWRMVRSVKSNAIVLATQIDAAVGVDAGLDAGVGFVLNGVGAGQMSRVDSVRLALAKAARPVAGSVLASDAFFPFADGVEAALSAGVRAFVQPGGSIRDEEILGAVDAAGGTMVFTGVRHFRH